MIVLRTDRLRCVWRAAGVLAAAILLCAMPASADAAPAGVVNGDLEQVTNGEPNCFSRAGWGDNTATWALTTDAASGQVAQSLTVTNYASGDRKLIMTESGTCAPAVTPGATYALSVAYKSTTPASLTVFRHSAAGWTYWTELKSLPAAETWTTASAVTPTVPDGTDQISFGVSIAANGTLVTDDYAMASTEPAPTQPSTELTYNGGLEQGGSPPDGWFLAGWGDAQVTSAVTSAAHGGTRAHSLTLAGRTQGISSCFRPRRGRPPSSPGRSTGCRSGTARRWPRTRSRSSSTPPRAGAT